MLRAASYFEGPRPFEGGGLAAAQAEMARNIVDHGRWFVINRQATDLVTKRQVREHRLVDFSRVDFSQVDSTARAEPAVDQMPGVALVLAGLWWATDTKTYTLIEWLQILIDTSMVLLVYWIACRLTRSTRASLLSAFLYAIWAGAIVVAKRPSLDTWAVFFTIACVAAFIWARESNCGKRLALLGLLTGVGIYFRPFIVIIPLALALVATPHGGWKRRFLWMFAPTAVALLILAPWTTRNYYEFHRFIPTRTGLGQAVFQGIGQAHGDQGSARYVREHKPGTNYGSPAYDDFLLSGAVRAIAHSPGHYLGIVARRARLLLPCLLVLLAWRRWRTTALIPLAAAAATIMPYLFIGDDTRFYLPAAFAYFILFAMALEAVITLLRRRVVAHAIPSRISSSHQSPVGHTRRLLP
jgi:4-amino-4-deoxy-L-arabinose transferase-like glycosyltransferase